MEIDALKGALVKAFSDRFPRFAAVHQRTQVSVSVGSQMQSKQSSGPFPSFLENDSEI